MDQALKVDAVLVGQVAPLGESGAVSAIAKSAIVGPVRLGMTGLEGDFQADTKVHGGPDKAVHHYPRDHYSVWRKELPEATVDWDIPGAFGENISTVGATEAEVCIGDLWRVGSALLEVSQARQPCWKLNHRFGVADMSQRVQTTMRTGWYYRVIETGAIAARGEMRLVERAHPDWTLARLLHHLYVDYLNTSALEAMVAIPQLAESWRKIALRRLEVRSVEAWNRRLKGSAEG